LTGKQNLQERTFLIGKICTRVKALVWYNERFDSDLERELDQRNIIANGKKFLDLGTGPATQAIWLVRGSMAIHKK